MRSSARLPRLIDNAHAALADESEHFELRKSGAISASDGAARPMGAGSSASRSTHAGQSPPGAVGRDGSFADGTDFRVHADS